MNKLKTAVFYEYLTKTKAMGIFYLIQYSIYALIFVMISIFSKDSQIGSNAFEFSSIVFVSIIGVLVYK